MIQKEKLNYLTMVERRQLIVKVRELYYAVDDYFRYGLDDDFDLIRIFGRDVLNELNQLFE